jgi:hypothetical protein
MQEENTMRLSIHTGVAAAALIAFGAGTAHAQFITSITRPTFSLGPTQVYNVNTQTGVSSEIFDPRFSNPVVPASAPGFTGLAADEAGQRLFAITTNGTKSDLYSLDYATRTPTLLASLTRPSSTTGIVFDGLAYDTRRNVLYGTRVIGGSTGNEGLFTIDIATGATTLAFEYEPTSTSIFQIGGLDYDPTTDRIYLSDDDDTGGRNIFSMDPTSLSSGLSLVTAYPAGVTDIDGIGAGGGKLYLLSDSQDSASTATIEGNSGLHRVFNILTGQFEASIASPYPARTTTNAGLGLIDPTGGGAYAPGIPAPASALALGLGAIAGRRRRR